MVNTFNQKQFELDDANNDAVDGRWEDAERKINEWDAWIKEKLKELKLPNVEDLLPKSSVTADLLLRRTAIGLNASLAQSGSFIQSSQQGGGGVVFDPPCLTTLLNVTGPASVTGAGQTVSVMIYGDLEVCWDTTAEPGSLIGEITGGSLDLVAAGVTIGSLVVDTSTLERSVTASENGTARIGCWFNVNTPSLAWRAVIQRRVWIDLPLAFSEEDDFSLSLSNVPTSSLVPRYRSPFTDYNFDGFRVWASDYAAFLSGWNLHEAAADRDMNGQWTQTDIDLWTAEFNRDVAP